MCKRKQIINNYIAAGMLTYGIAFLLGEVGWINHPIRFILYVLCIVLDMIGLIKYRQAGSKGEC